MRRWNPTRNALSVCVAAALLAGCGVLRQAQDDMQPPIGAPGTMPQTPAAQQAVLPAEGSGPFLYVGGFKPLNR
ncbi:MAG: hypothetical protein WBE79_02760 [Candidatus Cybelea sp.]